MIAELLYWLSIAVVAGVVAAVFAVLLLSCSPADRLH
jgi:hypothetical protein